MHFRTAILSAVILAVAASSLAAQEPVAAEGVKKYEANWESLDSRPLPGWFNEAKFGIFVVWGPYSVPAYTGRGYAEWYGKKEMGKEFHAKNYGKDFSYEKFAPMFTAGMWNPDRWADLFARSGAKYVVTTAVYHDGFCLWPSPYSTHPNTDKWNSTQVGPMRDIIGELNAAGEKKGLKMGIYYSIYEWWHPLWTDVTKRDHYTTEHFHPQFKDVVTRYKPWFIFLDGEWEGDYKLFRSMELASWLYNDSPVADRVVVNDRWGKTRGKHGDVYSSEYGGAKGFGGHPWQEDRGMGRSYGYNRNERLQDYNTPEQLIEWLLKCVSNGGNLLLDVGPTADGRIPVIMEERLVQMGDWLKVNGEAIYGTRRWAVANKETDRIYYTAKGDDLYVVCTKWPGTTLTLAHPKPDAAAKVTMLGHQGPVPWEMVDGKMQIGVPQLTIDKLPCRYAWTLKIPGAARAAKK